MELEFQRPGLETTWVKHGGALDESDGNGKDAHMREDNFTFKDFLGVGNGDTRDRESMLPKILVWGLGVGNNSLSALTSTSERNQGKREIDHQLSSKEKEI